MSFKIGDIVRLRNPSEFDPPVKVSYPNSGKDEITINDQMSKYTALTGSGTVINITDTNFVVVCFDEVGVTLSLFAERLELVPIVDMDGIEDLI